MGKERAMFAALALAAASLASATTVRVEGWTNVPQVGVINGALPIAAGEFVGKIDGKSFKTFSTDLAQYLAAPVLAASDSYAIRSTSDTRSMWGSRQYSDVSKLFTSHYGQANTATGAAAFQLALWEILFETSGAYDVAGGSLRAAVAQSPRLLANNWLKSLGSVEGYAVQSVYSGRMQDFLIATVVPEPGIFALALVSAGVAFGFARRRRLKD